MTTVVSPEPVDLAERADVATRAHAFGLVLSGTMTGLPIPERICLFEFRSLTLTFDAEDAPAVDTWATHLGLSAPKRGSFHTSDDGRQWVAYRSSGYPCPHLPGWSVQVSCTVTVATAPAGTVPR